MRFTKKFNESAKKSITHLAILKGRLTEIANKIEAIEERYAIGELEKDLYTKFISKYRIEKSDVSKEIDSLDFKNSNLEKRVERYCQILQNLPSLWKSSGYKGKLELQELLFPKGIMYDREKSDYRTTEINEVAFAMAQIAKGLARNEKEDSGNNCQKSSFVQGRLEL